VLLVDDDEDEFVHTRDLLRNSARQYELDWASSCTDGLERLRHGQYGVAIVDYRLGAQNGIQLLRDDGARRMGVPIILLTGQADAEIDREAMEAGAVDYLVKRDVSSTTLQRAIRYAIERQKVVTLLEHREAFLRAVIENSSDAILLADPDGTIRFASESTRQVEGCAPADLIGRNFFERIVPEDIESIRQMFSQCLRHAGVRLTARYRAQHHDGTWRIRESVLVNRLNEPAIHAVTVTARDITERATAEADRAHLAAIVEYSADAILSKTVDGIVTSWNKGAERLYGYTATEIIGQSVSVLYPSDSADVLAAILQNIRSGRPLASYEAVRVAKGGARVWVSLTISPIYSPTGVIVGAASVAHDITERKAAEDARARLVEILEATPDLVGITDPEGRLFYLNPAGRSMVGVEQDVDISTHLIAEFHPNPTAYGVVAEGISTAVRTGAWSGETELASADGRIMNVSQIILAHKGPDGALSYVSTIARDITERKRLERQFLQAQKMEVVGHLAGGVAHDFNNLLTVIIGFGELSRDELPETSPVRRDIDEVLRAAHSASALTRRLLAFSRRQMIQPQILDLDATVQGMKTMLRRLIGEDIKFVVRSSDELGMVNADRGQVEQVVMNLVVNARDAMPTGGHLTIETANAYLDEVYATLHPGATPGAHVMLAIGDTGCGMDEGVRARLFEPFFTTKELGRGTGLGLSTVYGIVKQNGGSIWVYSEPGAGTTFKVYFPRASASHSDVTETDIRPQNLDGVETILIVEDQAEVRAVARQTLQRHGYTVIEAAHGQEAIEQLEVHPTAIDLLLTDVVLPGMSGRQVAEELQRRKPDLRVLYMSGYTDDTITRHGVLDRSLAFLEKPFTADGLLQKIRSTLGPSLKNA
jgi:PAS domain S-box-containing protein